MTPLPPDDGLDHADSLTLDLMDRRAEARVETRVSADVAGGPATILDISLDGVRLSVAEHAAEQLGSRFRLQVPGLGIDVELQRAWVRRVVGEAAECGALLVQPDPSQEMAWQRLLEMATEAPPSAAMNDDRPRPVPAEPHLAAWVSPLLASMTMGGWSHHLARLR